MSLLTTLIQNLAKTY